MSKLREQMRDAMVVRGFSPRTQDCYITALVRLSRYYNPHRKHSSIDYRSPVQFERESYQALPKQWRTALNRLRKRGRSKVKSKRTFAIQPDLSFSLFRFFL